ncbi:hypothetical protein [Neogemmobacter tilapiae]|uniref:hypothetical protein n=1 Tax=Neogemmobacter tilapiae TaxID=875041 RepID=UPI001675C5C2|nr:hypothetical protein [Gemmobacter tilapiae]
MQPYTCKNGEVVQIAIDEDDSYEAKVFGPNGEKIGGMVFHLYEDYDTYLKLTWMYLDVNNPRWKRQGIGREILLRVKAASDLPITASSNDGQRRDDGSHLTGDGPAFVAKMRQDGIIANDHT